MNAPTSPPPDSATEQKKGLAFALVAYFAWGLLPLYFVALAVINPFEVVAWRIVFTLVLCALLLTLTRGWGSIARVLRRPKTALTLVAAGLVIYVNWQVYVIASMNGQVVEAALGYFVNPVVTILLGVILLGERLRFWQWFALAMTAVAFVIIAVGYGSFPWISLILATSFGIYGYMKKGVGRSVGPVPGLFVETLGLAPLALIILAILAGTGPLDIVGAEPVIAWMLVGTGVTTAVPLLLFAAGARRMSLTALGFTQYLAPTLMFAIGWLFLGEEMPPARWIGFGVVWVSLVILSVDMLRASRSNRRAAAAPSLHTGPIPIGGLPEALDEHPGALEEVPGGAVNEVPAQPLTEAENEPGEAARGTEPDGPGAPTRG